jgi:predicted RecA/RadA family phage recombinase
MGIEAKYVQDGEMVDWTANAAFSAGDVIQLRDGRPAVVSVDCVSGETVGVFTRGIFNVPKTTSMVVLVGSQLFWDHSADKVHLLHRNDRDFFFGAAQEDATAAATTINVALGVQPFYSVSLEHGFATALVQTAGFPYAAGNGRGAMVAFSATNEAQKADALSLRGMARTAIAIVDCLICVNTDATNAAADINIGLANGTNATDADTITESLFVHLDGASTNINIESDDGTTEVAATDSTLDYTVGTPFLAQFDLRNLEDIQVYIDGVNVLPASVFKLNAATGPLRALLHAEKTANATPGAYTAFIGARTAQV